MELTAQALKEAKFRGPVRFYDGPDGWARQDFQCIDQPRFGYAWQRENRKDKGRQWYMVDGREVASFDEAVSLLSLPPDADSPDELQRKPIDEFKFSPRVSGATRALSEARCNADVAPLSQLRAWMRRADHPWHVGINKISDAERQAGRDFPHWLYHCKSAAHELSRSMYLFAGDREKDTDLRCALGIRCRDCTYLQQIAASMREAASREKLPADIDAADIDAAKAWTCIGHVLVADHEKVYDGMFLSTESDRKTAF